MRPKLTNKSYNKALNPTAYSSVPFVRASLQSLCFQRREARRPRYTEIRYRLQREKPIMDARIYLCQGDITRLSAHAVVLSTSTSAHGNGMLQSAFESRFEGFATQFRRLRHQWSASHAPIGEAVWLPLTANSEIKPGGVAVVAAAGGRWQLVTDRDWKADAAVAGALRCAIENARLLYPNQRLLIALPTLRIGSGGSANIRMIAARSQIQAARETLKNQNDVDCVFVAYTPEDYQVFLEARRREKAAPTPRFPPPDDLSEAIASGRCVPFVGAGLSQSCGLPDWKSLVETMAAEAPDRFVTAVSKSIRRGHILIDWLRTGLGSTAVASFSPRARPGVIHHRHNPCPHRHAEARPIGRVRRRQTPTSPKEHRP